MQRQVPQIQTLLKTVEVPLNQVTRHAEFPQTLFIDKVVDKPVGMSRKVLRMKTSMKTGSPAGAVRAPGDQACRVAADSIHRHGCCRCAGGDATTGPSGPPGDQACRDSADSLSPQERIPDCIAEQGLDVPEPQIQEQIVGDVQGIPSERLALRTGEHIQVTLCTAIQPIDEQIADSPVPLTQARLVEIVMDLPEHLAQRTGEHFVDVPGPLHQERLDEVVVAILERVLPRTGELCEDVLVPQRQVELAEVAQPSQHARTSARTVDQMVDVPVPQLREQIVEGGAAFLALSVPRRSGDVAGAFACLARQ